VANSWSHRIVRPLARPLIRLGVTPNQITALHLVMGLGIVATMIWGTPQANLWAGVAWLVACLLDRLDGEVARIGNMTSVAGHRFDDLVDTTLSSLYFLGLGLGLRGAPYGGVAVVAGVLACVAQFTLSRVAEAYDSQAAGDDKILASRWGFDADDGLYLLGPLLWFPAPVRTGAAVLAALATTGFLLLFLRRLARQRRETPSSN
jgi:archaetidylinositol phosphate synthase